MELLTPPPKEVSAGLCWRRGTEVPLGALDAVASGRPIEGRSDSLEYPRQLQTTRRRFNVGPSPSASFPKVVCSPGDLVGK